MNTQQKKQERPPHVKKACHKYNKRHALTRPHNDPNL